MIGASTRAPARASPTRSRCPAPSRRRALNLLTKNFHSESTDTNQVVFAADDVNDPATKARIEQTLAKIKDGPHVERVDSPFAKGAAARQISKDGTIAFANVHMDGEQPIVDVPQSAYRRLIATAEKARGDGLKVELGGSGIQQAHQDQGGGPSEFIGFIAARDRARHRVRLAVRDAAAAGHGRCSRSACGTQLIGLLAHAINIATFAPILATLIGLGVGIDYALFIVTRHRNGIKAGRDPEEAIARALEHVRARGAVRRRDRLSSRCSACSCSASASSTASRSPRRSWCCSRWLAAVTLLPALLGIIRMRCSVAQGAPAARRAGPARAEARVASGRAGRRSCSGTRLAARRRRADHHARAGDPGALAAARLLRRGATTRTSTTTRKAYDLLADGFGAGLQRPAAARRQDAERQGRPAEAAAARRHAEHHRGRRRGQPAGAVAERPDRRDRQVAPTTAPQDEETSDLIDTLRDDVVPTRRRAGLPVYVGGITAIFDDFAERADRQAAAVHRRDRRARLPAADDRVPQHPRAADRGGDEPARGGRRVRRRHRGLPVGLRRRAARGRDRAGRGVPAGDDARDPVRAVDGLPGVPGQPHARGVGAHARQRPRGARPARPRPGA